MLPRLFLLPLSRYVVQQGALGTTIPPPTNQHQQQDRIDKECVSVRFIEPTSQRLMRVGCLSFSVPCLLNPAQVLVSVSYTHLRAHETEADR
eukprot:626997-Amphidinium_carterae.1